jgi:hypothetical protein
VTQAVRFRDPSRWCLAAIVVITVVGVIAVGLLALAVPVLP